jgi:hypothetical protein
LGLACKGFIGSQFCTTLARPSFDLNWAYQTVQKALKQDKHHLPFSTNSLLRSDIFAG